MQEYSQTIYDTDVFDKQDKLENSAKCIAAIDEGILESQLMKYVSKFYIYWKN